MIFDDDWCRDAGQDGNSYSTYWLDCIAPLERSASLKNASVLADPKVP